jgi:hypothetical protein
MVTHVHYSGSGCSNLCSMGGVEMVSNTELPVAIERDCSCNGPREAIAGNSLTDVSIKSGSNLIGLNRIEMVLRVRPRPPVAMEGVSSIHLSRVNKTLCAF